jgi:hypothetical protein
MSGKSLLRRLEPLETKLAPAEENVLTFVFTEIGSEGEPTKTEISEWRFPKQTSRR